MKIMIIKKKYEELLKEHHMLLEFPLIKNTINKLREEIDELKKNNSKNITLVIDEKQSSNISSDDIGSDILKKYKGFISINTIL